MTRLVRVARGLAAAALWRPLRRHPALARFALRALARRQGSPPLPTLPALDDAPPREFFDRDGTLGDGGPDRSKPRGAGLVRRSDGSRAVWKDFGADSAALRREAAALARLARAGVLAPRPLAASPRVLLKSYVDGPTLREELVAGGARIRLADTESDPDLARLPQEERLARVWERGRQALERIDEGFVERLARSLDEVHRAGVTGCSVTFGNVVLSGPERTPVFIDFDKARVHDSTESVAFHLARDRDRRLVNRVYGAQLLTEGAAADLIARVGASNYAPLDLGRGLLTRGFWSRDSGTGRWEFLNRSVLEDLLPGARILDLGSHNGTMPLLMLCDGAASVTAVERDPAMVEVARVLHRVLEWRSMRALALELRAGDMLEAISRACGPFDIVTAFCSLYYLDEEGMASVVRQASKLAPTLVLQAKTDTRKEAAEGKAEKSSVAFLARLMRNNGFPDVSTHGPKGFSRPLLIGRRP